MTNSPSELTVTPALLHIALQSSAVATSTSENRALEKQDSSCAPTQVGQQQQQQQLLPSMAVEVQSPPAAVASHMTLGLSFRGDQGPSCSASGPTSSMSPFSASQASGMVASDGMLTGALQPGSQQQQQYSLSSSTGWQGLCSTLSPPHREGTSAHSSRAAAAAAGAASSAAELSRSSSQHSTPPAVSACENSQKDSAAAAGDDGSSELPLLARELCVTVASLVRLFRADADAEFEQPVWMVVNLQGKIKGSYTAEKMLEFCRRGTLSAAQMVLGIDKNLPYVARQELAFYRPLGQLIVAVHAGARYTPLTEAAIDVISANHLTPAHWSPLVNSKLDRTLTGDGGSDLTSDLCSLNLDDDSACGQGSSNLHSGSGSSGATSGSGGSSSSDGPVVAAAAAARLRSALQRLCGVGHQGGRVGVGSKQPLWLYINHLGWCRGPFSGGKVMHAHLCGRLPRNTLVVAYDPELPACMISGDVGQWFRPLGALLDNVANGWAYNTVKWPDVVNRGAFVGSTGGWEPLVWLGAGSPPPLVAADQLAPPPATAAAAAAGATMPQTTLRNNSSGSRTSRPSALQVYSTGSTMHRAVQVYGSGGTGGAMQGPGMIQAVQVVHMGDAGRMLVRGPQEMHWQPQQQQQQQQHLTQAPSSSNHLYFPSDVQAGMMSNTLGAEGITKQNVMTNPEVVTMMQQQQMAMQQQRGVLMFPNFTPVASWESGSFPTSSSSNGLPSTSLGSSSTATGHTSLAQHATSGTASPTTSLAGTSGDSNIYSTGQYAAAAAVRVVDPSYAAVPAWWQQQQQQYGQVMGASSPFLAALSSAELAGQQQSGVYTVMPPPQGLLAMRPAAGYVNMSGVYEVSSSPMVMPHCVVPHAAASSGSMMMLLQQQQQQQHNSSPIQQQQQQAAQQQQQQCLLLDSQTFSSSLASAGSGPFFWQAQ